MDSFIKLGQQAYQQYSDKQSHPDHDTSSANHPNIMGGAHLNRPAGGQMIDTDGDSIPDFDQAAAHASGHTANSGDSSLFNSAITFLKAQTQKDDDDDEIDEHKITQAHDRAYNRNEASGLDAKSMGAAAALQAFKQFSLGGGSNEAKSEKDGQSKLLGMAMAQAAKLFDSSGGAAGGQKQDAVNSAGKMIMKLMMKQKLQQMGGGGGGGSGGGLGGLASMISKFA